MKFACSAATAAEHVHLFADDFGRVTVLSGLVLPFTGLQPPFDVNLRAFFQIFAGYFGQTVKKHDSMPFGGVLAFAALLVFPTPGGCQADGGDGAARGHVADFGVGA